MVQGVIMFIAVVYVSANLLVDILYGFLDPRIKYGLKRPWKKMEGVWPCRKWRAADFIGGSHFLRAVIRNKLSGIGFIMTLLVVLVAVFAPVPVAL